RRIQCGAVRRWQSTSIPVANYLESPVRARIDLIPNHHVACKVNTEIRGGFVTRQRWLLARRDDIGSVLAGERISAGDGDFGPTICVIGGASTPNRAAFEVVSFS